MVYTGGIVLRYCRRWMLKWKKKAITPPLKKKRLPLGYETTIGMSPWRFIDIADNIVRGVVIAKIKLVDTGKMQKMVADHTRAWNPDKSDLELGMTVKWAETEDIIFHVLEEHFNSVRLDKPQKISEIEVDCTVTIKGAIDAKGTVHPFNVPRTMISGDVLGYTTGYTEWENLL
jgi:hypothetical protein